MDPSSVNLSALNNLPKEAKEILHRALSVFLPQSLREGYDLDLTNRLLDHVTSVPRLVPEFQIDLDEGKLEMSYPPLSSQKYPRSAPLRLLVSYFHRYTHISQMRVSRWKIVRVKKAEDGIFTNYYLVDKVVQRRKARERRKQLNISKGILTGSRKGTGKKTNKETVKQRAKKEIAAMSAKDRQDLIAFLKQLS